MKRYILIQFLTLFLIETGLYSQDLSIERHADQYFYSEESDIANIVVRVGDIDNLGFGWTEGFDPFSGENTVKHEYPWTFDLNDYLGTDRIMVVSSYQKGFCDGYAKTTRRPANNPVEVTINYTKPTVSINKVILQMMLDDFQAPRFGTSFQVHINDKRLPYMEDVINKLKQSGPIGKIVQIGVLPEDNYLFETGKVRIKIDDPLTGAGDGFAIDFIQILINPITKNQYCGKISGVVRDVNGNPLENILVSANNLRECVTPSNGEFVLSDVPVGLITLTAKSKAYSLESVSLELHQNENKTIKLIPEKKAIESADFFRTEIVKKGFVNLYGIYFDSNSSIPNKDSESTLRELAKFINSNPAIKLMIIGHTDSDGSELFNQSLSEKRSQSVINWLNENGVNIIEIHSVGMGESSPIASNSTELGKALNRRVELNIIK
jgi:outer membrane protein OmpA-like peptidoglycan-associated protein